MSVTHTPAGYVGTVDEIAEAKRFAISAPRFRVASVSDWAVSVSGSVNRTILVNPGTAIACGVFDTTGSQDSVAFGINSGGSNRFDALVATFDWTAHTVVFQVIPGTTSPPLINASTTSVDTSKINRIPGLRYDALLAVVKVRPGVGLFTSGDLVDCRMWAGYEGFALVGKFDYLTMLDTQPGSLVQANDTNVVWNRLAGGVWGFQKWAGTDKTTQPMLALRNSAMPIVHNTTTTVTTWPTVVDHSLQMFTLSSGLIQCNYYGNIRIDWFAFSDSSTSDGNTDVQIGFPAGGGNPITEFDDQRYRAGGFVGSGTMRQPGSAGPVRVSPGDAISARIYQWSNASSTINYDISLACTYV